MDIKRDQRERMAFQRLHDLRRGRAFKDIKALAFKHIAQKRANLSIVFDNQDLLALHTKLLWLKKAEWIKFLYRKIARERPPHTI